MLNTKELRIGNYVSCSAGDIKRIESGSEIDHLVDSEIPILITEDLLIKGGFVISGNENSIKYYRHIESSLCIAVEAGNFSFRFCDKIGDFTLRNNVVVEIKYVHQLQNLFFCLVGKEMPLLL